MEEYQYCVVRPDGIRNGEVLHIADSLEEARQASRQFKADGIKCAVHSYHEIKKMDYALAMLHGRQQTLKGE